MVGHHPVKFGDYKHSASRYLMFLVVEEQDFICCPLNRH